MYYSCMGLGQLAFEKIFHWVESINRRCGRCREFYDTDDFPWVARVEAGWSEVRAELDLLLKRPQALPNFQDIQANQVELTTDDRWKVFLFHAYGTRYEPNLQRCPKTAALLSHIPGMKTAMFSILRGPKNIPPHRGPFNGVLRYHLALKVPGDPDQCQIRVGTQWRSWITGKSLIFDDTIEHEVVDKLYGPRVVLFVDFLRPAPLPLRWLNSAMIWAFNRLPFIQDVLTNLDRWNVDFQMP